MNPGAPRIQRMRKLVNRFLGSRPLAQANLPVLRNARTRRAAAAACAPFFVGPALPENAAAKAGDSGWILYGNPEFLSIYAHTGKGNFRATDITGPRVAPPSQLIDLGTEIED